MKQDSPHLSIPAPLNNVIAKVTNGRNTKLGWAEMADEIQRSLEFDERFLDRHAGSILSDAAVSIVELVANAWDAYATDVAITWPSADTKSRFSILDNGKGMTAEMFERRWRKIDYNRKSDEGDFSAPPSDLPDFSERRAYGRNGRGRHASFRFSDPYIVRTWRDGVEATFEVRRDLQRAFDIKLIGTRDEVVGHGTEISATAASSLAVTADQAREIIGTRFLADPNFKVSVDGVLVTFEDVPPHRLNRFEVKIPPDHLIEITVLDTLKADKTTRQHGIVWQVNKRMVGNPSWSDFDKERIVDGRKSEAKRYQIIVKADFLLDSVEPDWKSFLATDDWRSARKAVYEKIHEFLAEASAIKRAESKSEIKQSLAPAVAKLSPMDRERWDEFVDQVIDTCPSISQDEAQQVAGILAKLEFANSKYEVLGRLHDFKSGDFDELNEILKAWNIRTAKLALDEIQSRLKLIEELDSKLRDENLAEVADLQPLLERSLWVFGPEFESIEYTSNRGMTEVISKLLGKKETGTRLRPDFVVVPDGSVGFYSRDAHGDDHEVIGISRVVVVEIKKVGVSIGASEKTQPWNYVKELISKGLITASVDVNCFVLGSQLDPLEAHEDKKGEGGKVVIKPLTYNTFIKRAEARMLGLRKKLVDAPFMQEAGFDAGAFVEPPSAVQGDLGL